MKTLGTLLRTLSLTTLAFAGCKGDEGEAKGPPATPETRKLHVASPDWSEQIIYFVLTDRFNDGDPTNDDQGQGEFDQTDQRKYQGGDLKGIQDKLDYIQGLGATAVWITPPVANQWWDPLAEFGGYHGYWARNPKMVDEHQGTLDDYKNLSAALHDRGMYLIQDIVPNHMGNFFTYAPGSYDPADPTAGYVANSDAVPTAKPELAPFDQNDPSSPSDRATGIYHFTPPISDYNDPVQEKTYQVSDLDDLATENPTVRSLLRDAYGYWISEVGVDGFRVDTAKFIEPDFWHDFIHSPGDGVHDVARRTGRTSFFTFGEIFEASSAFGVEAELKIHQHTGSPASPGLDAGLGFPLYTTLGRVLGEGRPTEELAFRLERGMSTLVRNPYLVPTFVDNHDVARFITRGGADALRQGLRVIFTIPGVPVIYQGTEQAFSETRPSMFAAGWGSAGKDHFDDKSTPYKALQELIALRKSSPVYTKGELVVRQSSPAGPGVVAYERKLGDERALVVLNTSPSKVLVSDLESDLVPGQRLVKKIGELTAEQLNADANGKLLFELGPMQSAILYSAGETDAVTPAAGTVSLDAAPPATLTAPWRFSGHVTGASTVKLVVDDNLARATTVTAMNGTFTATLTLDRFAYGDSRHTVTIYAPDAKVATPRYPFTVSRTFDGVRITVTDPEGDDSGPAGNYLYPKDTTFGHQMDIESVTVEAGATLALVLQMRQHTISWNPSNGFDHVCFNIFFELPGQTGSTNVMPLLSATTPEGFTWTRNHFAFGWSNNLRSAEGATADQDGAAVTGAPTIATDVNTKTIRFTYEKAPFGLSDWTGVRIYISTWDFDGIDNRFRPMMPEGGQWVFGGAEETAPKIMDDVGPITVPAR